jgi:aminomethyltransferase
VLLARTGYTGEDGFELYADAPSAAEIWRTLLDAGEGHGLVPAGLACRDTLRLEAGMALYGHELSTGTDPFAARLGRIVAFRKDFVGRAALHRLSKLGPARSLTGLAGTGRRAARAGCAVHDVDGRTVGVITSGALSPTLGHPIAMSYLDAHLPEPGTELTVDVRGHAQTFAVVPLPFHRR